MLFHIKLVIVVKRSFFKPADAPKHKQQYPMNFCLKLNQHWRISYPSPTDLQHQLEVKCTKDV